MLLSPVISTMLPGAHKSWFGVRGKEVPQNIPRRNSRASTKRNFQGVDKQWRAELYSNALKKQKNLRKRQAEFCYQESSLRARAGDTPKFEFTKLIFDFPIDEQTCQCAQERQTKTNSSHCSKVALIVPIVPGLGFADGLWRTGRLIRRDLTDRDSASVMGMLQQLWLLALTAHQM